MDAKKLSQAAAALGSIGGSRNTEAQNAARAKNAQNAGRKPLCVCGHSRKYHARFGDVWKHCAECECKAYQAPK